MMRRFVLFCTVMSALVLPGAAASATPDPVVGNYTLHYHWSSVIGCQTT